MNRMTAYVSMTTIAFISGILVMKEYSNGGMGESPSIAAQHLYDTNQKQRVVFDADSIKQLQEEGFVVFDNILTKEEIDNSRKDIMLMLQNKTKLKFYDNGHNSLSRTDKVSWIAETIGKSQHQYTEPNLLLVLRVLRSIPDVLVKNNFNKSNNMGVPFSNQLSIYANEGSTYVAHFDKPETKNTLYSTIMQSGVNDRIYTILLYLNSEQWSNKVTKNDTQEEIDDSGSLRITKLNGQMIDIEAKGGRLIIFDSSTILHEVRPNFGLEDRFAITCWAGGNHSEFHYCLRLLQYFNIPLDEYNWKNIFGI